MPTLSTTFRTLALGFASTLLFASPGYTQETVQAVDPRIAVALKDISPARVQANIEKLVSFGTRSTLSAQDPASIARGQGIGAAREWIKAQFERYSKDCGGCLEVKTDVFTQAPGERIPQPTDIVNVYAVMRGSDPEAAKRIVLVTGHYDSRVTDVLDSKSAAPGANDDGASAPAAPANVRVVTSNLDNDSTLKWDPSPNASSYEVIWRTTSSPLWEHAQSVGNVMTTTLKLSKDNVIFAVRAVDRDGHRSLPVLPLPER